MTTHTARSTVTPSILIVDDSVANLELLSAMLHDRGYEPRSVPSGKLALLAVKADPPDLILLDINMPEMDGYEVCTRFKAEAGLKDIPVIFLTAFAETAEKVKAFSLGAVDYITKPFQVDEVEARVRTHLGIRSLQRELSAQNERLEYSVAERTRELADTCEQLAQAYDQLLQLDRLKADFMRMISHEIRTPANGVFGIGELVFQLCPEFTDRELYRTLFDCCRVRLLNLIEDATLIADFDQRISKNGTANPFSVLFAEVRADLPEIRISVDPPAILEAVFLQGDHALLKSALTTLIRLATCFSRDQHTVQVTGVVDTQFLRAKLELDALTLSSEAAVSFFELGSSVRSASHAEPLGLAPVVAQKIISAFGGELRLVKVDATTGYLEALLTLSGREETTP